MKTILGDVPIANEDQTSKILKFVQFARDSSNVKIGCNESTKALDKGKAHLIIIAADCEPIEIIALLPVLCQDKNIPIVAVESKSSLGKACSVSRDVVALAIVSDTEMGASRMDKSVRSIISGLASTY